MFTKSFAIKIGKTTKDTLFAKLLKNLVSVNPFFTVEGLTHKMRSTNEISSLKLTRLNNKSVCNVGVKEKKLDYLTVGFSNQFDVSFEEKSSLYVGPFAVVKILDVNKDFIQIIKLLGEYVVQKHSNSQALLNVIDTFIIPNSGSKRTVTVVKHSCYAEVDGRPVSYQYKKKPNRFSAFIGSIIG